MRLRQSDQIVTEANPPETVEYDELTNLALVIHNEFRAKHTDTEPLVIDSKVTK